MKTKCPKCKGKGRVQLPPTYPPRPSEYTWTDCECVKKKAPIEIPPELFDGHAVFLEVRKKNWCVDAADVSDVLDAVVSLIRKRK